MKQVSWAFGAIVAGALTYGATATSAQDVRVTEAMFTCISRATKVRNTYIGHADPARLKEAVRIFENHVTDVEYPVGTVLQLIPGEAMVKHPRSAFPRANGWEFFALEVSAGGAKITSRGDQAANKLGTCLGCHEKAAKFDYVCERTHGCASLPVTDQQIAAIQAADPRCAGATPRP